MRTHERKYLGDVLTVNEYNYYIPMSSPKKSDYLDFDKKIIRNDTKTIIRIHNGNRLYGTLRISNMVPVPITELEPYMLSNETDMNPKDVAKVILDNVMNYDNLNVADIIIERN